MINHIDEIDLCKLCKQTAPSYCNKNGCIFWKACVHFCDEHSVKPEEMIDRKGHYKGITPNKLYKNYFQNSK